MKVMKREVVLETRDYKINCYVFGFHWKSKLSMNISLSKAQSSSFKFKICCLIASLITYFVYIYICIYHQSMHFSYWGFSLPGHSLLVVQDEVNLLVAHDVVQVRKPILLNYHRHHCHFLPLLLLSLFNVTIWNEIQSQMQVMIGSRRMVKNQSKIIF